MIAAPFFSSQSAKRAPAWVAVVRPSTVIRWRDRQKAPLR